MKLNKDFRRVYNTLVRSEDLNNIQLIKNHFEKVVVIHTENSANEPNAPEWAKMAEFVAAAATSRLAILNA